MASLTVGAGPASARSAKGERAAGARVPDQGRPCGRSAAWCFPGRLVPGRPPSASVAARVVGRAGVRAVSLALRYIRMMSRIGPRPQARRMGRTVADFERDLADNLHYERGTTVESASAQDAYWTLAITIRDRLAERRARTAEAHYATNPKFVYYLSAEYMLGRQLRRNALYTGTVGLARRPLPAWVSRPMPSRIWTWSRGSGTAAWAGWPRACSTRWRPWTSRRWAMASGTNSGSSSRSSRTAIRSSVPMTGPTTATRGSSPPPTTARWSGSTATPSRWTTIRRGCGPAGSPPRRCAANPVTCCTRATAPRRSTSYGCGKPGRPGIVRPGPVQCRSLRGGRRGPDALGKPHQGAIPERQHAAGQELRLKQQYFLVSCSLRDIIRRFRFRNSDWDRFPDKVVIQLNDTHPVLAIPELMRLLVDENGVGWQQAWSITRRTFAYTCHTLLPEALETWPLPMFGRLLPRHLEIIYALNQSFLDDVRARYPGDSGRIARVSLIQEGPERRVRMANLAALGSFAVNGVAELQSRLLTQTTLRDFADLWPGKFLNVTNGVSPRRFLALANPRLSALITGRLGGDRWLTDLERLRELEAFAGDEEFAAQWREVKRLNKLDLAARALAATGVAIDPGSLFDVTVKRMHEYKRQLLKLLHVLTLYNRIKADPARHHAVHGHLRRQGGAQLPAGQARHQADQLGRGRGQR